MVYSFRVKKALTRVFEKARKASGQLEGEELHKSGKETERR